VEFQEDIFEGMEINCTNAFSGWQYICFTTLLRDKEKRRVCDIRKTKFSIFSTTPFSRKQPEQLKLEERPSWTKTKWNLSIKTSDWKQKPRHFKSHRKNQQVATV
jgi:hypothetical protein